MKKQIKKTEQFCHSILQLELESSKALANLVMGLSSQTHAQSVVEVSLSGCYHYQFSSVSKSIKGLYAAQQKGDEQYGKDWLEMEKKFGNQTGSLC